MAEEIKNTFGGFDAVLDQFLPSDGRVNSMEDRNEPTIDPEDIKRQMEELDNVKEDDDNKNDSDDKSTANKKKSTKSDIEETEEFDDSKIDKKKSATADSNKNNIKDSDSDNNSNDEPINTDDIEESDLVDAFSDIFADELGWEFSDEDKPKSVKELVEFMQEVIETNSQPKYASDEIKDLDEYVKQGGDVKHFFSQVYSTDIDPDKIDITKESNQKAVIKDNLRSKGYSETRIDKLISRYEETGALEEEAADSLEEVKEYREKTKQTLLEQNKKQYEENVKEQLKFVKNVESIIKDSKDIRGISISEKDRKNLVEYIFKPKSNGLTSYQEDYNSNLQNLVESAYFTMKKDALVQQIEKKASTDAVKNLKLKLKTKGKSTKNAVSDADTDSGKVSQLWEIASRELKTFN